jgi:hypothetical protein
LVRAELRDQTDVRSLRGTTDVSAFFEDAADIPGAIAPSGIYLVTGTQVSLKLRLSRNGNDLSTVDVQGSTNNLSALATKIVDTILEAAKTLEPIGPDKVATPSPAQQ